APAAGDEDDAELVLERTQLLRQRGLGHPEPAGGGREATRTRDRDEVLELAQRHDKEILYLERHAILDPDRRRRHGPSMERRTLLKGTARGALARRGRRLLAAGAPPPHERSALVVVYLNGGPAGLFTSAGSFLAKGSFGVTH